MHICGNVCFQSLQFERSFVVPADNAGSAASSQDQRQYRQCFQRNRITVFSGRPGVLHEQGSRGSVYTLRRSGIGEQASRRESEILIDSPNGSVIAFESASIISRRLVIFLKSRRYV